MAGLRLQNNKVVQYPSISPTPAVSQPTKIPPRPTIDADSGGTRIIPINVDPGYRPKSPNRAQANIVFGERYISIFHLPQNISTRFISIFNLLCTFNYFHYYIQKTKQNKGIRIASDRKTLSQRIKKPQEILQLGKRRGFRI